MEVCVWRREPTEGIHEHDNYWRSRDTAGSTHRFSTAASSTRFFDLPTELRNMIYELYLAPLTEQPLHSPTWPPLARVNQALRDEVMPLFLHAAIFDIHINGRLNDGPRPRPTLGPTPLRSLVLRPQTTIFFSTMSEPWVSLMRNFRICLPPILLPPFEQLTPWHSPAPTARAPAPYLNSSQAIGLLRRPNLGPALWIPPPAPGWQYALAQPPFCVDVRLREDGEDVGVRCRGFLPSGRMPELEAAVRKFFRGLERGDYGGIKRMGSVELSGLRTVVERFICS